MVHLPSHSASCGCTAEEKAQLEGGHEFLYGRIDRARVEALNTRGPGGIVIKPWEERMEEQNWLESEDDEGIVLRVPFDGSVKLKSILVKAGPAGFTPDKIRIFSNMTLDFSDVDTTLPTQEFDLIATREVVEFILRPAKFPAVSHLTLHFPRTTGEESSRISFIGFRGEYKPFTRDPVITVYEIVANPADHQVKGMDEASSRIG